MCIAAYRDPCLWHYSETCLLTLHACSLSTFTHTGALCFARQFQVVSQIKGYVMTTVFENGQHEFDPCHWQSVLFITKFRMTGILTACCLLDTKDTFLWSRWPVHKVDCTPTPPPIYIQV
jgi:hypothetical protein